MYIVKNALRCIGRSKARNILIGIIVLVIAVSSCIGLSIRKASENAKEETMEGLSITATLSYDRQAMMEEFGGMRRGEGQDAQPPAKPDGDFDRDSFKDKMGEIQNLSLDEYQKYADASTVKEFNYTVTSYFNGSDELEAVSTTSDSLDNYSQTENQNAGAPGMPGGHGMGGRGGMNMGDFTIIGYSSDNAMTDFSDGNASIVEGSVFAEATDKPECVISQELATFNEIVVGDEIVVSNPENEDETYTLTVVGVYEKNSSQGDMSSKFGFSMSDPANEIYMSYAALDSIISKSESSNDGDNTLALRSSLDATYTFADVEAYEVFCEEVYTLGLDEKYIVSSADVTAFENSLVPLETLSTTAGYFLLVILLIGVVILVVLSIFNVRERKYEIGVLTAMGMKKFKVAMQFLTEIFVVTIISVIIGVIIGAATSVPVANALLENQVESQSQQYSQEERNFGREKNMGMEPPMDMPSGDKGGFVKAIPGGQEVTDYVTQIDSAMDLSVVLQMFLIAIGLTLVSGMAAMLFVMRYEPLKILSNRD